MKLNKYDIGGEIISILTKGMYPDPKDALREYIQNGVDAAAKNINLKVRQDTIVVEDDGIGMNHDVLRKAVRVGISEKNPSKYVGFMGIGIYSSFHLCEKLTIYSKGSENIPNKLEIDFGGMRAILEEQKEKRLSGQTKADELIDLQTLLEQFISLTENKALPESSFPIKGTRVELTGLETEFYTALSNFDEVAEYLRNVIPLHFDKNHFSYANEIEDEISRICEERNQKFEIINLKLQINSKIETLYRPYKDIEFYNWKKGVNDLRKAEEIKPLPPIFHTIENGEFFGVAWGCLNSVRKKIENKSLRGFILKKQGFSIGNRATMVKFFPRGNTFFDRYSGEIIIVNPKLIPNASRTELEYSPLRSIFYEDLTTIADNFDDFAHQYQEFTKGDDELAKLNDRLKAEIGSYNENEGNPEVLVNKIVKVKDIINDLEGRINRKGFRKESQEDASSLLDRAKELETVFQERLKSLTEGKKKKQQARKQSTFQIAKKLSQIRIAQISERENFESLFELLKDLEFNIDEELKEVIFLIDEKFIQKDAASREEYYLLLNELKEEILNNY